MDKKIKLGGKIIFNEVLARRTSLGIGGKCELWAEPKNENDLKRVLAYAEAAKMKIFVIGNGTNVLAPDGGFKGIVVHLGNKYFKKVSIKKCLVKSGAGISLSELISKTCEKGCGGLEGLSGIPGTLGGAIFMNASYKARISDFLQSVKVMDKKTQRIKSFQKNDFTFNYRASRLGKYVILEASLKLKREHSSKLREQKKRLLEMRKNTQPVWEKSAGCVFKNPKNKFAAGYYIEKARLKGKRIGTASVSGKHANYIVTAKNPSSRDFLKLMNLVKKKVNKKFGIDLKPEIIVI